VFLKKTRSFIAFALLLGLSGTAFAARVTLTKNNKVMIDNQNTVIEVGQDYYLVSPEAKKTAVVQITAVKNGKAIGTITRGKSSGNETLELKATAPISENVPAETESAETEAASPKLFRYGSKRASLLISLFNNSMTAKESDGQPASPALEDVSMKGSSVGITGVLDLPMNSWFTLRGTAGYEPFSASGTSTINGCDNTQSTNCTTQMTYISFGAYGRFEAYRLKSFLFWLGLGGTIKYPISKNSTALKTDDIKMTGTYGYALGADYLFSHKVFIPFSIEQQTFMPSDTVKASYLAIRFGVGLAY
jgi:opacity protein-like surface antigen